MSEVNYILPKGTAITVVGAEGWNETDEQLIGKSGKIVEYDPIWGWYTVALDGKEYDDLNFSLPDHSKDYELLFANELAVV